jgi:hypothetical protein
MCVYVCVCMGRARPGGRVGFGFKVVMVDVVLKCSWLW